MVGGSWLLFTRVLSSRIVAVVAAICGVASVVYVRGRAVEWDLEDLRPFAEQEASAALGRPVRVGRITGNLFRGITLHGLSIGRVAADGGTGDLLTMERVVVRYSLWAVIGGRVSFQRSIQRVEVLRPRGEIRKLKDGSWQLTRYVKQKKEKKKPKVADRFAGIIQVYEGDLRFCDESTPPGPGGQPLDYRGTGVDAIVDCHEVGLTQGTATMAIVDVADRATLTVRYLSQGNVIDILADADGLRGDALFEWVVADDDPSFRFLAGTIPHVKAGFTWSDSASIEYFARGEVDGVQFELPGVGAQPFAVEGDLVATSDHVASDRLWLTYGHSRAFVSGSVLGINSQKEPKGSARIDLEISSKHVDFGEILQERPLPKETFERFVTADTGSADLRVVGSVEEVVVDGRIRLGAAYAKTTNGWEISAPPMDLEGQLLCKGEYLADLTIPPTRMSVRVPEGLPYIGPRHPGEPPPSREVRASGLMAARLTGPLSSPRIVGDLRLASASALGIGLTQLRGRVEAAQAPVPPGAVASSAAEGASPPPTSRWLVRLSDLESQVLDGSVRGAAAVEVMGSDTTWALTTRLEDVDLDQLNRSVEVTGLPVEGRAFGTLVVSATPGDPMPDVALKARSPDVLVDRYDLGQVVATAQLLDNGRVEVTQLSSSGQFGHLEANGTVPLFGDERTLDLAFESDALDLAEFSKNVTALSLDGEGLVRGSVQGTTDSPRVAGAAQALNGCVSWARAADGSLIPASLTRPGQPSVVYFDSAQARFDYHDRIISLADAELRRGPGLVRVLPVWAPQGMALSPFVGFEDDGTVRFGMGLEAQDLPAGEVSQILGIAEAMRVDGLLSLEQGMVAGQAQDYQFAGGIRLADATVHGYGVEHASADVLTQGDDLVIDDFSARVEETRVDGEGRVARFRTEPEFVGVAWRADRISLARIDANVRRAHGLRGVASAMGGVDGPIQAPVITASAESDSVWLQGEEFTNVRLEMQYFVDPADQERVLWLGYPNPLVAHVGGGVLQAECEYEMNANRISATGRMEGIATGPLSSVTRAYLFEAARRGQETDAQRRAANLARSLGGAVSGRFEVSGPVDDLEVRAQRIELADATYRGQPIPALAGSLRYQGQTIEVHELSLADPNGKATGSVWADLGPGGTILGNLTATGVRLAPFAQMLAARPIIAEGTGEAHIVVRGPTANPVLEGGLRGRDILVDLDYDSTHLPRSQHRLARIDSIQADGVSVREGAAQVAALEAKSGGTSATIKDARIPFSWSGVATPKDEPLVLVVDVPEQDLSALASVFGFSPESMEGRVGGSLRLSGTLDRPSMNGDFDLRKARFVIDNTDPYLRAVLRQAQIPIEGAEATIRVSRQPSVDANVVSLTGSAGILGGQVRAEGKVEVASLADTSGMRGWDMRLRATGLRHKLYGDPRGDGDLLALQDLNARITEEGGAPCIAIDRADMALGEGQGQGRISIADGRVVLVDAQRNGFSFARLGLNKWNVTADVQHLPVDAGGIERIVRVGEAERRQAEAEGERSSRTLVDPQSVYVADFGFARLDGKVVASGKGEGDPTQIRGVGLRISDADINIPAFEEQDESPPAPTATAVAAVPARRAFRFPQRDDFDVGIDVTVGNNVEVPAYQTALRGLASLHSRGSDAKLQGMLVGQKGEVSYYTVRINVTSLVVTLDWSSLPGSGGEMDEFKAYLTADGNTSVISKGVRTRILIHLEGPLAGETLIAGRVRYVGRIASPYGDDQPINTGPLRLTLRSEPPLPQREILQLLGQGYVPGLAREGQTDYTKVLSTNVFEALASTFVGSFVSQVTDLLGLNGLTLEWNPRTGINTFGIDRAITDKLYLEGWMLTASPRYRRYHLGITYDLTDHLRGGFSINETLTRRVELRYQTPF